MLEVIEKANREITIKDCLSMTSGLPYNCDSDQSSKDVAKVFDELDKRLYSDNPMTTLEMVKKLGGCHLVICNHMDAEIVFESGGAGLFSTIEDYKEFTQMLLHNGEWKGRTYLAPKTVEYMTNCHLQQWQRKYLLDWESLAGFDYGNLMRIMTEPSLAVMNCSMGEYGWDGWLGPYFANLPNEDVTFLMMMQRKDTGTFTLTRKLRNALAACF